MRAIYKRELLSYFRSPIGWVAVALYALLGGFYFGYSMSATSSVNISEELGIIQEFFMIVIPVITMRLFSEEKKNGTDVLLYTSSVPLFKAVLGKYLAALSLFFIMLSTTIIHVVLLIALGGNVNASTLGSYISMILIGALFIAVGIMASAVTENQIIAAVISAAIIVFTMLLQIISSSLEGIFISISSVFNLFQLSSETINKAGENLAAAINWLDPISRTASFQYGIISLSPILLCLSLIALFLFLTYRILEKRRWSQG